MLMMIMVVMMMGRRGIDIVFKQSALPQGLFEHADEMMSVLFLTLRMHTRSSLDCTASGADVRRRPGRGTK